MTRTIAAALDRSLPQAQWPRTVTGKGESSPVAPNTSAANRRLNRRVTISYVEKPGAPPAAAEPNWLASAPRRTPPTGTSPSSMSV